MSVIDAAEPREPGQDFQFVSQVINVFPSNASTLSDINDKVNLITTAGKYGLIFISNQECIKVYFTASLIDGNEPSPITSFSGKGIITHISTSCDSQTLFVCGIVNDIPFSFFYDVFDLISKRSSTPWPFYSTPLCTLPGSKLSSFAWNPCDPCCIAIVISNGDLSILRIKEKSLEFSAAKGIRANAVTWSAKGKQLAVGKQDGMISLFKPDLSHVRDIDRPLNPEIGSVIDITWFTNTEFFVGYLITNYTSPVLLYVNAPKGKLATFYTFEDVCYSSEREKPVSYYSHFFFEWNLLLMLSSNGVEMGVVGKSESNNPNECQWCQWFPDDGSRASMNFINVVQETYPLGLAVDFTSKKTFGSKDEQTRGPLPVLLSLSTGGDLNIFYVENRLTETPNLNILPESIPTTGFRTPEQYGQTFAPPIIDPKAATILQLNRDAPSAFSSVPKAEVENISKFFSFSTPIKPMASPIKSELFASPVISTVSTVDSVVGPTISFSTSSPFVPKPVSLSSEVGVSSNFSKTLHVPSPKKSLVGSFAMSAPVSPSATAPSTQFSTSQATKERENASLNSSSISKPIPKAFKQQLFCLIKNEMDLFDQELLDHSKQNEALHYKVGTKESDLKINTALNNLHAWMVEMKKTTEEINEEVCQLHKNTFEALASYEDASSHCDAKSKSRNVMYMQLRPLDPYSQRRINEIRSKYHYLSTQIVEVIAKLDLQWEEYCSAKKPYAARKKEKSTTENLYNSILKLHNSRVSYEKQLNEICKQFKKCFSNQLEFSTLSCNSTSSNYSFQDNMKLIPPSLDSHSSKKLGKVSPKKLSHLQDILSKRDVTPVRKQISNDASRKLVINKISESQSSILLKTVKKELSSPQKYFANQCTNDTSISLKYEDISPPSSPEKFPSKSSDPLAALSSLVGKVSQPSDHKGTCFSYLDTSACQESTFTAQNNTSLQNKNMSAFVKPTLSFSATGPLTFSAASPNVSNSLSPSTTFSFPPLTQTSAVTKTPVSSMAPLLGLFKTNQSISSNSAVSAVQQSSRLQDKEVFSISSMSSPTGVSLLDKEISSKTLLKNGSLNSSSIIEERLTATPKSDNSERPAEYLENRAFSNNLSSVDKVHTTSSFSLAGISSKSSLFSQPETTNVATIFNLDSSAFSSPLFEPSTSANIPNQITNSSLFSKTTPKSAPSIFGLQATSSINTSSLFSKPTTISSLLQPPTTTSAVHTGPPNTSSILGLLTSAQVGKVPNASCSPTLSQPILIGNSNLVSNLPVSTNPSSNGSSVEQSVSAPSIPMFGQLATTSASVQVPLGLGTSLFGQSGPIKDDTLFKKSPSSSGYVERTHSDKTLQCTETSINTLFKQSSSIFGQGSSTTTSLFGGSTSITPVMPNEKSASSDANSATSQSFSINNVTQSGHASVSTKPLFGQLDDKSGHQATITNFPSLLAPKTPTSSSIFNQSSPLTSALFGQLPATSTSSVTGQTPSLFAPPVTTVTASSTSSIFGSPPAATSIFGNLNQAVSTNSSIFGNAAPSQSIFGNAACSTKSVFGTVPGTSTVGSNSIFGQKTLETSSSDGSTFGQSGSIFGVKKETDSSLVFGNNTQNSSSIFGAGNPPTTSTVTSNQQTIFSTGFSQQSSNSSVFGGGSLFSGLGKAPNPEDAAKNVFGNISGGGSSGAQASIFGGGGTSSSFGSSASNATTGIGAFSPVKTGGSIFGGAPTFGGSPSFGGDPTISRTTAFGGSSAFGSTSPGSSIFGGNSTFGGASTFGGDSNNGAGVSAFGSTNTGAGFSSFANAGGTATFGGLAGNQTPNPSNSGGAPPFGGSSFSGWRS